MLDRISGTPTLRPDLTISRQESDGRVSLVIKDPATGRFFRLGETERFIIEQLDGVTSVDAARQRVEAHFGATLPPEVLGAFLTKLSRAGLLDTGRRVTEGRAGLRKRIRGSLLYLRVPLFDPDSVLTKLAHRLRFVFTAPFLAVSLPIIFLGFAITLANAREIGEDLARLYQPGAIPLLIAVILVIGTIHEFGHGVTCKHFGGEVHETGFMLMYFQPAFYCNVSDAWLFRERSKRIWVGLGGPFAELSLWALATMAWRVTETDTWINFMALTVMMISGIKSLFNFNPFIKLDGYYVLSDFLDIPNLRTRAFRYVGDWIKRIAGTGGYGAPVASRRERTIYLAYGLAATAGSFGLLAFMFLTAGQYLIDHNQAVALAGLTGFSVLISRKRLQSIFSRSSGHAEPAEDGSSGGTSSPPSLRADAKVRRRLSPRLRRVAWMAAAATVLVFVLFGHRQLRIAGSFDVLPEKNADVRPAVDGIIDEVLVDEGALVKAGDVIARLSDRDLRAQLLATQARVNGIQANVSKLEGAASFARGKLARAKMMFDKHLLSAQELESEQQGAGAAMGDIHATKAELDGLESQRRFLEQQLELLKVVSPVTGVVATPSRELHALKGQLVGKGALIAKVYEVQTVAGQITVPEKEIADVQVGQRVLLRSRAYPNREFQGTVTAIATAAQGSSTAPVEQAATAPSSPARRTFIVTTQVDNRTQLLKPGMTGQAKIYCGDRRVLDLIVRRLAATFKVEFWSWL